MSLYSTLPLPSRYLYTAIDNLFEYKVVNLPIQFKLSRAFHHLTMSLEEGAILEELGKCCHYFTSLLENEFQSSFPVGSVVGSACRNPELIEDACENAPISSLSNRVTLCPNRARVLRLVYTVKEAILLL